MMAFSTKLKGISSDFTSSSIKVKKGKKVSANVRKPRVTKPKTTAKAPKMLSKW